MAAINNVEGQQTEAHILTKDPNAPKEVIERFYDDWAPNYDQAVSEMGYVCPDVTSNVFQKFVASKNARILDVAAGTGLGGQELRKLGYDNIDAIDGSSKILEEARRKNIYINLQVEWIGGGKRLNINDDVYDAIISVGSFGLNCLCSDCFPELIRIVKPGGIIVFGSRSKWLRVVPKYSDGKLDADMNKVEAEGKWKLIERKNHSQANTEQDVTTFTFRVC